METYSNYYIMSKNDPGKMVIVTDQNPTGVTLILKDENSQIQFSLSRIEMIEALEYLLMKIKARPL